MQYPPDLPAMLRTRPQRCRVATAGRVALQAGGPQRPAFSAGLRGYPAYAPRSGEGALGLSEANSVNRGAGAELIQFKGYDKLKNL